jgi:exopolysaccharide production protein ExoZ
MHRAMLPSVTPAPRRSKPRTFTTRYFWSRVGARGSRNDSIQALRALAALAVIFCHYDYVSYILHNNTGNMPFYPLAAGVDLFFVISGFIMVYSSEDLFGVPGASRVFLAHRISRIVPLY